MTGDDKADFHAERRIAIVTGGTSGIGEAIARALAGVDYQVFAGGLGEDEVARFQPEPLIKPVRLDVTDDASIQRLVERCPRIDALVNCAGVIRRGGAEFAVETFSEVVDVNLTGTMRMCGAARPKLAVTGGAIVNMASMLSFFGSALVPAYSASKGGIMQLTKSLAAAWASDGIRVNALAPGWIATELTRNLTEDEARSRAIVERTPLGRWGKPEDLAGPAVFLLSDAARFITGVTLPVDGGYLAV